MLIKNNFHYPVMLRLQGKLCVIIGGGAVALRKMHMLAQAGASVRLVAISFLPELLQDAQKFSCEIIQDNYKPEYLSQAFITIAATDDAAVNRQICQDAPCLCNNITEPELSSFTVPSSFTQGDITVALATGGMPAFTRLLKQHLQQAVTPEIADFNAFLLQQRTVVRAIPSTPEERTIFWRQLLDEALLKLVIAGNTATAKERVLHAISSFRAQSQNSSC